MATRKISIPRDFDEVMRGFLLPTRAKVWRELLADVMRHALREGIAQPTPMGALRAADAGLRRAMESLRVVQERSARLQQDAARAVDDAERRQVMIAHLIETVPDLGRRKGDLRALDRALDIEALVDREIERAVEATQTGMMCLEILRRAYVVAGPESRETWREDGKLLPLIFEVVGSDFKPPFREEAFLTLAEWVHVDPALAAHVERERVESVATDRRENVWVQAAAIRALAVADADAGIRVVCERLGDHAEGDDFLVRRNAMLTAFAVLEAKLPLSAIAERVRMDPSEHVRQSFAEQLLQRGTPEALEQTVDLVRSDAAPKVRGWALRELIRNAERSRSDAAVAAARAAVHHALSVGTSPLVIQLAVEGLVDLKRKGVFGDVADFVPALVARTTGDPDASERAAAALRSLQALEDPLTAEMSERLVPILANLREWASARLEVAPSPEHDVAIMRALRDLARGDLTVAAARDRGGYRILRGERRARRAWRTLHELRNWAPDKRSGYIHTNARVSEGEILVPPIGMAEVTPTPVPGERNLVKQVASWGPFLPRVDDFLAASRRTVTTYIVTSAGIISLIPPAGRAARLRAYLRLTFKYSDYADTREHSLRSIDPPDRQKYLHEMEKLGFRVVRDVEPGEVSGVPYEVQLPIVGTFFPASHAVLALLVGPLAYMYSNTGNVPAHLAVMTFFMYAYVVLRAALVQRGIEGARESIPLRIGGWGTRGKSGTERLKAGLFQGLGYNTVVKTTGCEAMFIHAVPWQKANEIFLFRPYDKPTIWEQRDVLRTGQAMKAQVFLWECMALRPNFVALLGHGWMQDEITTLTNAYPDHEDVMGPNGEEVARVISIFMSHGGTTFTTEVEMLPVLREAAVNSKTRLREVPVTEGDLITDDILRRFPYDEHPRNISLVATMAEFLGIDRERALVEMADNVVPDLGVLKTYPKSSYRGRTIQFSNGMSANERAGFLSCWGRLGFDNSDPDEKPLEYVVTIINNRADRVPRSRVFARIHVRDAERHGSLCIGTNLTGLVQFIEEELGEWLTEAWVADENFKPGDAATAEPVLARYDETMKKVKIASQHERVLRLQLGAMLKGAGLDGAAADKLAAELDWTKDPGDLFRETLKAASVDDVMIADAAGHASKEWQRMQIALEARAAIAKAKSADEANALFRDAYKRVFMDRIHVLWNALSTGDQVADRLVSVVPPGFSARLMGVQNIKGTGLDFVYRWLSLDSVEDTLNRLRRDPDKALEPLGWLASYNYGIIECNHALDALRAIEADPPEAMAPFEEQFKTTLEHVTRLRAKLAEGLGETRKPSQWEIVAAKIEPWLDFIDSTMRRRAADGILRDFIERRSGHLGAAALMRDLTKRDKGGWLVKWVQKKTAKN